MREGRTEVIIQKIPPVVSIIEQTGRIPEKIYDPINDFVTYRWGQPVDEIFEALDRYQNGSNGHRKLFQIFRDLRNETYALKRGKRS